MNNITDNAAMITKFQAQSNTFATQAKFRLHKPKNAPSICRVAFNQVTSCGKLNQYGKQAALFAIRANAVFFTLAFPLHCLFSMVNKGKARLVAAASYWQFSTLALCLPPLNCGKLAAAWKNQYEKAHSMQTQSTQNPPIQQATPSKSKRKSGFFSSIWRKGFPSIDAIVKQVSTAFFNTNSNASISAPNSAKNGKHGTQQSDTLPPDALRLFSHNAAPMPLMVSMHLNLSSLRVSQKQKE